MVKIHIGSSYPRLCLKKAVATPRDTSQRDHRGVNVCELVEERDDPAVHFQPAKHAFDHVALSVVGPVEQSG